MFMKDATAIVAAVGDPDISAKRYEKDTMIPLEHMVLAATALGYGTCWIGAFDENAVKSMLRSPKESKWSRCSQSENPVKNLAQNLGKSFRRSSSKKKGKALSASARFICS